MYHLGYGGYIGGVQGYPLTTRPDETWDWSEHFSWVKGNHTIKMGGNFQRAYTNSIRNDARTGLTVGYFAYYTGYLNGDRFRTTSKNCCWARPTWRIAALVIRTATSRRTPSVFMRKMIGRSSLVSP